MISDKKDLPNAIALNSSVMNGTRLIGPALAGVAIAAFGEGTCFFLNGVSYIAVLIALLMMEFKSVEQIVQRKERLFDSLRVGFHSALDFPPIRNILLLVAFTSLFGLVYATLFPALVKESLNGGADALGTITAASGFGALAGTLYLTRRKDVKHMGKLLGQCGLLFGIALIAVSQARTLPFMIVGMFFTGLGMMVQLACSNTVIQTLVEDDKRGRVMSFFTFSMLGVAPFGSLLMGWLAQKMGVSHALVLEGALCAAGSLYYLKGVSRLNVYLPEPMKTPVF
jgi:MFS family permease